MKENGNTRNPYVVVAKLLNKKYSGRQLCHHWRSYLDPDLSLGNLSDEEKQFIITWISQNEEKQIRWMKLRKELKDKFGRLRSENAIKNHYYSQQRSQEKALMKGSQNDTTSDKDSTLDKDDTQIRKSASRKQRAGTGDNSSVVSDGNDVSSIPSSPDGKRAGNSLTILDGNEIVICDSASQQQNRSSFQLQCLEPSFEPSFEPSDPCYKLRALIYLQQRSQMKVLKGSQNDPTPDEDSTLEKDDTQIRESASRKRRARTGDNSPVISDGNDVPSISSSLDGERAGNPLTILDGNEIVICDSASQQQNPPNYMLPLFEPSLGWLPVRI